MGNKHSSQKLKRIENLETIVQEQNETIEKLKQLIDNQNHSFTQSLKILHEQNEKVNRNDDTDTISEDSNEIKSIKEKPQPQQMIKTRGRPIKKIGDVSVAEYQSKLKKIITKN
jgi:predicted transcriptional regulator